MGMETVAIVLLVLFTLEIIFIFVYSSQKDDSDSDKQTWGPPELPRPPPTNIFELPDGANRIPPSGRPGRWDDDDYDFDGDFRSKKKLRRVKFFLVNNGNDLDSGPKELVESDFRPNDDTTEYTVHLDKIDYDKFKDRKLFMVYKPYDLELEWKLKTEDGNNRHSNWKRSTDGDINLGRLSKLKEDANGKDLILKIKVIDYNY
tara:strand:+ start:1079 stop:1687 length:609 start_codon:yes stop_codon:yes gene_type:complete